MWSFEIEIPMQNSLWYLGCKFWRKLNSQTSPKSNCENKPSHVKMKFQINKSPNWNPKLYKSFKIGYYVEMSNWDSKLGCQID
jgi:hypothetical protein